jgi:hypothetical protein
MLRISGFMDFVHLPEFRITRKYVLETGFVSIFRPEPLRFYNFTLLM